MNKTGFYWGAITALLILCAILFTCNKCKGPVGKSSVDTLRKVTDTMKVHIQKDTIYVPQMAKRDTVYVPRTQKIIDSFIVYEKTPIDTPSILHQWLSYNLYSDTIAIPYGHAYVKDTLHENKNVGRSFSFVQDFPQQINNYTVVKRPVTVYAGFSLSGSKRNLLYSYGADVGIMGHNGRYYGIGVKNTIDNQMLFEGNIKIPIRIK
jgi:hypothetical protein